MILILNNFIQNRIFTIIPFILIIHFHFKYKRPNFTYHFNSNYFIQLLCQFYRYRQI